MASYYWRVLLSKQTKRQKVCSQKSRSDAFSSPSMIFSGWIFCIDILYLPIVEVKHYGPIVADTKYKIYNNMSIFWELNLTLPSWICHIQDGALNRSHEKWKAGNTALVVAKLTGATVAKRGLASITLDTIADIVVFCKETVVAQQITYTHYSKWNPAVGCSDVGGPEPPKLDYRQGWLCA